MSELPKVTIPATPEMVMEGMTGVLVPTIAKCSLGGYMIVVPGRGVAAKSDLREAMDFLADQAFDFMSEPRRSDLPKILDDMGRLPETPPSQEDDWKLPISPKSMVNSVLAAVLSAILIFGVKWA